MPTTSCMFSMGKVFSRGELIRNESCGNGYCAFHLRYTKFVSDVSNQDSPVGLDLKPTQNAVEPRLCMCGFPHFGDHITERIEFRFGNAPDSPKQCYPADGNGTNFRLNLPATAVPNTDDALALLQKHHGERFDQISPLGPETFLPCPQAFEVDDHKTILGCPIKGPKPKLQVINRRKVSLERAQELLLGFRAMCEFYPFVVVPADATIQTLSRNSPFLLLAILTTASAVDVSLHHQLDHEFRRVLTSKIIDEGQKSLDYLQGLLVYIAWYPSHIKIRIQQINMYMTLAIDLATDLGLDHSCQTLRTNPMLNFIDADLLTEDREFSKASQRAYLGCYFLSTAIYTRFEKVNRLPWTDVLEQYGRSLAHDPEYPSDISLLGLVQAQTITERIRESLRPHKHIGQTFEEPFHAESHVRDCEMEAKQWRDGLPNGAYLYPAVILADRFMNVQIYSFDITFVRIPRRTRSWLSASPGYMSTKDLSRSLKAAKGLLEYFLSIPPTVFHAFISIQWGYLVQAFIVLFKLSFPMPSSQGWNAEDARQFAPLGMYLDALCHRLQGLSSVSASEDGVPQNPDYAFIFKVIVERLKLTFDSKVAQLPPIASKYDNQAATFDVSETPSSSTRMKHACPMFEPALLGYFESWKAVDASYGAHLTESNTSSENNKVPVYHDIWATMTLSWASD